MANMGVYEDVLNGLLFDGLNKDGTVVVWLEHGRWLIADCETPKLFVVSIRPAALVAQ